MQHNHTFLHRIIFISVTLQKLQNNYHHCTKNIMEKNRNRLLLYDNRIKSSILLLLFEITCQIELSGQY